MLIRKRKPKKRFDDITLTLNRIRKLKNKLNAWERNNFISWMKDGTLREIKKESL